MDTRRTISAALAIALAAPVLCEADAQGLAPYFQSSGTEQKPRSNAGLAIQGGDWLRVQADVALRGAPLADAAQRASGSTEIVPNLRSALSLAKNLDIETRVSFAEWNAGSHATADTRLRYRKSMDAFIDSLEGSIWRSRDGLTKQVVRLGFNQLLGDATALTPLTLTGAAIFEATQSAAGWSGDARRVGLETRVAGSMPRFPGADQSLTFKVEKTVGTRRESASSLAYDHAWTVSSLTNVGFKVEFPRRSFSPADDFEPSVGFDWRSRF